MKLLFIFVIIWLNVSSTLGKTISEYACEKFAERRGPQISKAAHFVRMVFSVEVNGTTKKQYTIGAIINDRFVITSASSFYNKPNSIFVQTITDRKQIATVSNNHIHIHPNFNKNDFKKNNIALLEMENIKVKLYPACIGYPVDYLDLDYTATTLFKNEILKVRALSLGECRLSRASLTNENICIKIINDIKLIEGTPFELRQENKKVSHIIGINSFYLSEDNKLFVGQKINTDEVKWIDSKIWQNQLPKNCGVRKTKDQNRMYHGKHPWYVAIYFKQYVEFNYKCSGTLISERLILTAAQCVYESKLSPESLNIEVGKSDFNTCSNNCLKVSVDEVFVHSEFSPDLLENDIAVLKAQTKIKFTDFVQPICLYHKAINTADLHMTEMIGWTHDKIKKELQTVEVSFTHSVQSNNKQISKNKIIAIQLSGQTYEICKNDIGGAAIFEENNKFYATGVYSWALMDGDDIEHKSCFAMIFTDITKDTSKHYQWIYNMAFE